MQVIEQNGRKVVVYSAEESEAVAIIQAVAIENFKARFVDALQPVTEVLQKHISSEEHLERMDAILKQHGIGG